jgi:hypothetical protein
MIEPTLGTLAALIFGMLGLVFAVSAVRNLYWDEGIEAAVLLFIAWKILDSGPLL